MPDPNILYLKEGEDLVYTVLTGEIFRDKILAADRDINACTHFELSKGAVLHIDSSIGTKEKPFPRVIIKADKTATVVFWGEQLVESIILEGNPLEVHIECGEIKYGRNITNVLTWDENIPLVGDSYY